MMYINHNSFNLNDLLVQSAAGTSTIYNPAQLLQPPGSTTGPTALAAVSYQQQLQSYNQQLQQHHNKQAIYHTYPTQMNPYDPNRTQPQVQANGVAVQQNKNGRSTSASSLSSVSSTSSTSSIYSNATGGTDQQQQAQTLLTNPSQQQQPIQTQAQFNPKLTNNNLYNPYNFAYYNPYTTQQPAGCGNASSATTNPISTQPKLQASLPNPQGTNTTTSQTKQETNNVLTTVDPNYQLNMLPTAASKATSQQQALTNPMQFSTSPTNLTGNCATADTSSLLLYNSTKNLQAPTAGLYNTSTHYKPTAATSQLTFLPTSHHTTELFTSNTGLHSTHLAGLHSSAFAAQPLQLHSFGSSKTQFSVGVKRKRRFKKPPELRNVLPKNSLMLLHEYRPNVEYRFVCQSGPIHRPMFTMCVDINEHKFEGTGKTKKDARMQAAEKALEFLIQHPEYIQKAVPADKSANNNSTTGEGNKKSPGNEEDEEQGDEAASILNEEEDGEDGEESNGKRLKKAESNENSNTDSASPVAKEDNLD